MTPLISICHATARPDKWFATVEQWVDRANSAYLEYILVCDSRWGFKPQDFDGMPALRVYWGDRLEMCANAAWNLATSASTGDLIVCAADDIEPPVGWDDALLAVADLSRPQALLVRTDDTDREIGILPIETRPWLDAKGGHTFGYGFSGMYADNEWEEWAKHAGVFVDVRDRCPRFEHHHPVFGKAPTDAVYQHQNKPQAYERGRAVLDWRRASGFPPTPACLRIDPRQHLSPVA